MHILKNKSIKLFITIFVIINLLVLGSIHCDIDTSRSLTSIINELTEYSISIVIINRITNDVMTCLHEKEKTKTSDPVQRKSSKGKYNILLNMLNSLFMLNDKFLYFLMMICLVILFKSFELSFIGKRKQLAHIKNKYYLLWKTKFMTPLEKCRAARSEEYDINSLEALGMVFNTSKNARTLFIGIKCGFFNLLEVQPLTKADLL